MPDLYLIFNHSITENQKKDALNNLKVERIETLPTFLQDIWSQVPPDLTSLSAYLEPIRNWLREKAVIGDYVLIQGDFGACYLLVRFALDRGLIPVYSTTDRIAKEEIQPDGTVKLIHHFQHRIFRKYGV
jgi:hypothetical protein